MRFHVVKRDNCPLWKKLCLYVLAVAAALGLGALVLLALGVDGLSVPPGQVLAMRRHIADITV